MLLISRRLGQPLTNYPSSPLPIDALQARLFQLDRGFAFFRVAPRNASPRPGDATVAGSGTPEDPCMLPTSLRVGDTQSGYN